MTISPEPRTEPTSDTKAQIRAATLHLLRTGGAPAVTHQRVAQIAGVGRATVYRHFDTPTDLVEEALASGVLPVLPDTRRQPLLQRLTTSLAALAVEMESPDGAAIYATVLDRARQSGRSRDLRDGWVRNVLGDLETALDTAVASGELTGRPNAETTLDLLLGPVWARVMVRDQQVDDAFLSLVVHRALAPWLSDPGESPESSR